MKNNSNIDTGSEINGKLLWFIKLRWIAIIGVIITVFVSFKFFGLSLHVKEIIFICFLIAFYNLLFFILLKIIYKFYSNLNLKKFNNIIANLQISLDILSLTILLHFSGGIENPFIFYYIFHVIISSIILTRKAAFLQTTLASFLFLSMAIFEYLGYIKHFPIKNFYPLELELYNNFIYVFAFSFSIISSLYIAAYMATNISIKLRQKERQLEESNLLLEKKDKIKSEYVLRVSHDIKEHLSAIQGCIEPVFEKITGPLNEKQSDLLSRALERTNKLLFFVKTLLEITRLRLSSELKLECFELKDVINDAINSVNERALNKKISINFNIDYNISTIVASRMDIQETISNLIMNSIKYTPESGNIDIVAKNLGDSVLIVISDNGIGIPKDEMPKIFQEFYRASNAKKIERTGTGLGLTLAKEVIEMHKGKIWVESEENKGTSIFIDLPKFQS